MNPPDVLRDVLRAAAYDCVARMHVRVHEAGHDRFAGSIDVTVGRILLQDILFIAGSDDLVSFDSYSPLLDHAGSGALHGYDVSAVKNHIYIHCVHPFAVDHSPIYTF